MYFNIDWDIRFYTPAGKEYQLQVLKACEVIESVDNLADTATITLPEAVMNEVLQLDQKITRGTRVIINLGYDAILAKEFEGFVKEVTTDNGALQIVCEDALFLFRVAVKDIELKLTSVKKIAEYLVSQTNPTFKVVCEAYDLGYEKFVIHQATAYDVLKKIQEETKANIYFNTDKKELHIHPPYIEKSGEVAYSPQINLQSTSLEYKRKIDRKFEITVERTGTDGKVKSFKSGTTGGDAVTLKVGTLTDVAVRKIADAELLKRSADSYEGSIESWLIPFVKPTFTAMYNDTDYPDKKGSYYVISVKTNVSESGVKRTIQLGVKLGNG